MSPIKPHADPAGDKWRRARFHEGLSGHVPEAEILLRVLLAQDGSATRLCEAIAGRPLSLQVRQGIAANVPPVVYGLLPGEHFIERFSSLSARGEVMMDNLVYVALDRVGAELRAGLERGTVPIGHLLETLWVRRRALRADVGGPLHERLWAEVGLPDPAASRAYSISTPDGPLFLIAETFRRGMRALGDAAGGA